MGYNVQDHGDMLEREASSLIRNYFPHYERVWSVFVGNKGDDSMALLPNYPDENKRRHFAENSYTVLESFFIIHHILESKIFEASTTTFDGLIDFNKAFILFFALLGRIHDTAIKASDALRYNNKSFRESIKKFYEARSIVIHGKKVPLIFDDLGLLQVPYLKTTFVRGVAWDDKNSTWEQITEMKTEYAAEKLSNFFFELIQLVNNEYAVFYDIIQKELNAIPTSLKFERGTLIAPGPGNSVRVSGSTATGTADVDSTSSDHDERR